MRKWRTVAGLILAVVVAVMAFNTLEGVASIVVAGIFIFSGVLILVGALLQWRESHKLTGREEENG